MTRVVIDRVVVRGVDPVDGARLHAQLERELARVLRERDFVAAAERGSAGRVVAERPVPPAGEAFASDVAARVASALRTGR